MRVGVPKEIKVLENRVGLVPGSVRELVAHGHSVVVEHNAGQGIGMDDDTYRKAGATVVATAAEVFAAADMIVKVKEPQAAERKMLRQGQILFTYLHLAPDPEQAADLVASGAVCIAYETVTSSYGRVAAARADVGGRRPDGRAGGRVLPREAARRTRHAAGRRAGRGSGEGRHPRAAESSARTRCHIALGMGAEVWVLDRSVDVLARPVAAVRPSAQHRVLDARRRRESRDERGSRHRRRADSRRIGAQARFGRARAKRMKTGSVIVDVAIDQGGCFETSRATTHADPVYVVDGVTHYCVANMPGGVPRTSTFALNNATLPFVLALAGQGLEAGARRRSASRATASTWRSGK